MFGRGAEIKAKRRYDGNQPGADFLFRPDQRNRAARIGAAASRMFAMRRNFSDMGSAAKRARACSLPAKMRLRISATVMEPRSLSLPVVVKGGMVVLTYRDGN
jgi:transposase